MKRSQGTPRWTIQSESNGVIIARMELGDWLQVPDHPRRRNTEVHANAPHWQQAKGAAGATLAKLSHVTAAIVDDTLFKIEGHTRAFLWANGGLPSPNEVLVTAYKVSSTAELNELYAAFDVHTAARTASDAIYGAYRERSLQLKSERLRDGFITDALNIALRGATRDSQPPGLPPIDPYKAVAVFETELKQFDALKPTSDPFYSGVVAAGLIGLALYGNHAKSFLSRIAENDLTPNREGLLDPAQAVLNLIEQTYRDLLSGMQNNSTKGVQEELCGRTMRGLIAWVDHSRDPEAGTQFWFKNQLRAVGLSRFIGQLKQRKGVTLDPNL